MPLSRRPLAAPVLALAAVLAVALLGSCYPGADEAEEEREEAVARIFERCLESGRCAVGGGGAPDGEAPDDGDQGEDLGQVQGVAPGVFFANNCAVCHGQEREGLVGPALTPERLAGLDAELLFNTIQEGREGTPMPAWGQEFGGPLSEEEIRTMVEFITTIEP